MTYTEAVDWLWSLTDYERRTGYDYSPERFDLRRVDALLGRLGDPHRGMRLAHVAGTKGKGSTSAMMASVYGAAGLRAGLYTSPHLHTVRERIRVGGVPISREDFAAAVVAVARAKEGIQGITSFEALTAAALLHFRQAMVDVAVMEVGLGGRLDATNVIAPFVSVITSISRDHTAVLGDTLAAIAKEKAGILKPGVPAVSAAQAPEVTSVIQDRAGELGCPLEWVGTDWRYRLGPADDREQEFDLAGPAACLGVYDRTYRLPLLGEHQIENAVLAVAAVTHSPVELGVRPEHARAGLEAVRWPGRLEVLLRQPYLVLDGAHNDDSFRRLREALQRHFQYGELHLVFGASRDKDVRSMLAAIRQPGLTVYGCRSRHDRAADPGAVGAAAADLGLRHVLFPSVDEALWAALDSAGEGDCVCVAGSLFVVAAAREAVARRYGRVDEAEGETEVVSVIDDWRVSLVGT
ncbi:MAG: bifunctional folylpolyglutamate synthase/dihydrofolate synthase [Anaerolineae bacterium]|nr:bifunctional folylpolyglutamate synthase/dihydrofolate synthase [Anaerolineae bacterium]